MTCAAFRDEQVRGGTEPLEGEGARTAAEFTPHARTFPGDAYFAFVAALFASQDRWAFARGVDHKAEIGRIAVLAGITAQYGIGGLQIATLMAGCILLAMGVGKLGGVIRFIPDPVIVGFTSGIAVIIWVGQWKDFFGLHPVGSSLHFSEKLWPEFDDAALDAAIADYGQRERRFGMTPDQVAATPRVQRAA